VANINAFKTTHISLDWHVDFKQSLIHGDMTLSMERIAQKVDKIILDCSSLNVIAVSDADSENPLEFEYNPEATKFGGSLEITVPEKDLLSIQHFGERTNFPLESNTRQLPVVTLYNG
jgi:aminopeptidase N